MPRHRVAWVAMVALMAACAPGALPQEPVGSGRAASASPEPPAASAPPEATAPADVAASSARRERARVVSVTDGDTIRVSIDGRGVSVRYIGIDAPETVDPRRPVGCFGKEASDANTRLVAGRTVELEKDVSETDRYGRLLRYVYVEVEGRGMVMVNEELVRAGYARASTYPPDVKYEDRFRALEAQARAGGAGLWGPACAPEPHRSTSA